MKDLMNLESLRDWLKTKPAEEEYSYGSNQHCLIAQFLKAQGVKSPCVGGFTWSKTRGGLEHDLSDNFRNVSFNFPRTFGGALARLEALL